MKIGVVKCSLVMTLCPTRGHAPLFDNHWLKVKVHVLGGITGELFTV